MNRQQKENLVQELSQKFTANDISFIVKCQGLTVPALQELRLNLEKKGSELKVAKNRLMKLAVPQAAQGLGFDSLLTGQTAVVFAKSDLTGIAKVLADFAKKNEEFAIVAGCNQAELFDAATVKKLAKIPSREVLLARLCGVLNAPKVKLVWTLAQIAEQKGKPAQDVQVKSSDEPTTPAE